MRVCLSLLCVVMLASVTLAQNADVAPFEWKLSGDSVENFSMEFVANHKTDQSTPTGTVLAYAAFSDNRESTAKMMKAVGRKWDAAVRKSLSKYEKELLTADAIEDISNHQNDPSATDAEVKQVLGATKVTGEAADKEGLSWVTTTQPVEVRQRQPGTEKWTSTTQELKRKFACKKGEDGRWRIMKIEQNGQEDYSMLLFVLYAQKLDASAKPVPAADTTTAKGAAKSLFESLLARRAQLDTTVHAKGLDDWLGFLKPLFTETYVKTQDELASQWIEQKAVEAPREVESVTDADGGLKVVKFKPRDQWTGAIEVYVKKIDGSWRVARASYQELSTNEKGKIGWVEMDEPNLYKLANR
ncbi:MAG: hypothetical protein KDB29_06550 [Planctomycetes bacterium]|nr:hypothetical protein [Planctomycetota bacterium]